MKLTEVIASMLPPSQGATEELTALFGEVYTMELEDPFTPLRDAREFATLLNACGRMGEAGLGIGVCIGDRRDSLNGAMKTLADYRSSLSKALEGLTSEKERLVVNGRVVMIRGDGIVDERLLGPVTSILTSSPEYKDKVVVSRTNSGDSQLKISCRVGDTFDGPVNLGLVMREAAEAVSGVGGGHTMAAGARSPPKPKHFLEL